MTVVVNQARDSFRGNPNITYLKYVYQHRQHTLQMCGFLMNLSSTAPTVTEQCPLIYVAYQVAVLLLRMASSPTNDEGVEVVYAVL